jgi:outer membrane protein assembly factor BamB
MKVISLSLFLLSLFQFAHCQIVNWRGINRDGHYVEEGLLRVWPEEGPELLFSVKGIGNGLSSAVAFGNRIFISGKIDSMEYLSAIDTEGNIEWQTAYGPGWDQSYPAARGSATIDDERVYVVSGDGMLACLHAEDGALLWSFDANKEFKAKVSPFGTAESPLIVGNKVLCTPTGESTTVVAFNKITGDIAWKSDVIEGEKAFCTPILYSYKDFRYVLVGTTTRIAALIPETGEIAWQYCHYDPEREKGNPGDGICMVNSPIYKEDEIFITKGYEYPAMMLKMDSTGRSVSEKWINYTLDNEHGGVVQVGDHIFGANYINPSMGKWVCLNWDTGEVTYVHEWSNKGSIVTADNMLYIYTQRKGDIALVRPNPDHFEMISSFQITEGKGQHWAHLSIYDGIMYVRRGEILMAYSVRK